MTTITTTVSPAEAGTTYPMPPGPAWASVRRMEEDAVSHRHEVGRFYTVAESDDSRSDPGLGLVEVFRWDTIDEYINVELADRDRTPTEARALASLLIRAAGVAEQ